MTLCVCSERGEKVGRLRLREGLVGHLFQPSELADGLLEILALFQVQASAPSP